MYLALYSQFESDLRRFQSQSKTISDQEQSFEFEVRKNNETRLYRVRHSASLSDLDRRVIDLEIVVIRETEVTTQGFRLDVARATVLASQKQTISRSPSSSPDQVSIFYHHFLQGQATASSRSTGERSFIAQKSQVVRR